MTTKDFTNAILNHKTGFVISTGDVNGECYPSCGMNTIFFDGASIVKSAYDSNWLEFSNEKTKGLGTVYIYLGDVQKVTEHGGDYLDETFQPPVQRVLEIEMVNEHGAKTNCTIGLLA